MITVVRDTKTATIDVHGVKIQLSAEAAKSLRLLLQAGESTYQNNQQQALYKAYGKMEYQS